MKLVKPLRLLNRLILGILFFINSEAYSQLQTLTINPVKDNTIFSENGNESNGIGYEIYVGKLLRFPNVRRGLMQFDLSGLPSNAIIQSANLSCSVTRSSNNTTQPFPVFLKKLTTSWGEGTSLASRGNGVPATPNDATWTYNFHNTSSWQSMGGDFVSVNSDTAIAVYEQFVVWDGQGLKTDIEYWRQNSAQNFGWILIGDENLVGSAIGLASRENPSVPKPTLTINYTLPLAENVYLNEVNPISKWIEIYNPGPTIVDLNTYFLKIGNSNIAISDPTIVTKMGSKQLEAGSYTVLEVSQLNSMADNLTLYKGNPSANGLIKDFVQFGQAFTSNASVAVAAGVWDNQNSHLTTLTQSTQSYSINGNLNPSSGNQTSSISWITRAQSPQYKNLDCPQIVNLLGNIIQNQYKSSSAIELKGTIDAYNSSQVFSTNSIVLLPNFSIIPGAVVEMSVRPCN